MPVIPTIALIVLGGFLASCLASFAFVVGERPARGEGIVTQDSYCTHCGTHLRLIDNIPVFGWLFNGGKAHCCKELIPSEYFWGETILFLLGSIATARILFGVPSYYSSIFGPVYVVIASVLLLAVWWRWEIINRQYRNYNVYIDPPVEIPSVLENSPQYVYTKAVVTRKKSYDS